MIHRVDHSRCYQATPNSLRMITAYIVLREKTLIPLLASAGRRKTETKPPNHSQVDIHYKNIQIEMQNIFKIIGVAA